ncbi:hypothetical protein [Streptomyces spongiicola]|uniref:hypothetical protein n=1 Tax=Streptomyces spongiicola TaxID=1690221 RepID=UPI0013A5A32C|nr:hypothetical protein [Streptomyces spongiicola]
MAASAVSPFGHRANPARAFAGITAGIAAGSTCVLGVAVIAPATGGRRPPATSRTQTSG